MNIISKLKSFFNSTEKKTLETTSGVEILSPSISNNSKYSITSLIRANKNWVYAAANKNANSVAAAILRLYSTTNVAKKESLPIVAHRNLSRREIKSLNIQSKINSFEDSTISVQQLYSHPLIDLLTSKNIQQMLYLIDYYLELTGNSYLYIIKNKLGIPIDLQLIPSFLVYPKVDENNQIYYEINLGNNIENIKVDKSDVIHFKFSNPANPIIGLAPLQSVIKSEDLYESMIDFEFALNKNSAIPAMIVKYISGELREEDKKKVEAEWNKALRGIEKSGKVKVTDENFEIEKLGIDPKDMQYLQGKSWVRQEIAAAFGVPLSLLTTDNVNLANATSGVKIYKQFTIVPRLQLIESALNEILISKYRSKERLFLSFDNIIDEDWEFKLKETTELFKAGIINQEEARKLYNLEIQ